MKRIYFEEIDSTSSWARRNGGELLRGELTMVVAGRQTAGRGRWGRKWESPGGQNIYVTFCFFPGVEVNVEELTLVVAVVVAGVLGDLGFGVCVKRPNDIMIGGKKAVGILTENCWIEGEILILVGIGINVNMPQEELDKVGQPATSLMVERGKLIDLNGLLLELEKKFESCLQLYLNEGFAPFKNKYESLLCS